MDPIVHMSSSRAHRTGMCSVVRTLESVRPVLRWAGGKRRLVHRLEKLMPSSWNNYVEPMAGSAALFFHVAPRKAILGDLNPELINFYTVLRDDTDALVDKLNGLRASRRLYRKMRKSTPRSRLERAIRFVYLNRLCWNGLYRVNQRGQFNVPIGDRLPKKLWDRNDFRNGARILSHTELVCGDFVTTLRKARSGDFVFIDPPYPRGAPLDTGFNRYCSESFSAKDHQRLGRRIRSLDARGVSIMVLLASSKDIISCYPSSFNRKRLRSKSLISCNASSRRLVDEIVLTNYSITDDL